MSKKINLAAAHFDACMRLAEAEGLVGSFDAALNAAMRCATAFPEGSTERAMFMDRYARAAASRKTAAKAAEKVRAEVTRTYEALSGLKPAEAKAAPSKPEAKAAPSESGESIKSRLLRLSA